MGKLIFRVIQSGCQKMRRCRRIGMGGEGAGARQITLPRQCDLTNLCPAHVLYRDQMCRQWRIPPAAQVMGQQVFLIFRRHRRTGAQLTTVSIAMLRFFSSA